MNTVLQISNSSRYVTQQSLRGHARSVQHLEASHAKRNAAALGKSSDKSVVEVSFTDQLGHLSVCAAHKGASRDLVNYAQSQTRKYIAVGNAQALSAQDRKRISAYFWAIIRKKAVTRNDSQEINQRIVLKTFVRTLQDQGRSSEDIAEQLVRNYASYAQPSVLDECLEALMVAS